MTIRVEELHGMDFSDVADGKLHPIHPGEILRDEFLAPLGMTPHALSLELHVSAPRINDIVLKKRSISADTALRLAKFFGNRAEFWMGLQTDYDVAVARSSKAQEKALRNIQKHEHAHL